MEIDYPFLNKLCRDANQNCVLFEHEDNEGTVDFYRLQNICPNKYINLYSLKDITSFDFYLFNGSKFAHNQFDLTQFQNLTNFAIINDNIIQQEEEFKSAFTGINIKLY